MLLLGQQFSILWSDYPAHLFWQCVCISTQNLFCRLGRTRGEPAAPGASMPPSPGRCWKCTCDKLSWTAKTSAQPWDIHIYTRPHLCQWGTQDDQYCPNAAHSSVLIEMKGVLNTVISWGKLHISKISVIASQTAFPQPPQSLKFPFTSGQNTFKKSRRTRWLLVKSRKRKMADRVLNGLNCPVEISLTSH